MMNVRNVSVKIRIPYLLMEFNVYDPGGGL
jgi:hypothetical protein